MRCRSAHPQVPDRGRVVGPTRNGPEEEQLFQRELALKDVAFGEPELALEIERRQHLAMEDDVADVRRVLREGVYDGVAKRFALLVPRAACQCIRSVLHEARQNVLAGRRDRRIRQRRDHDIDIRPA